MLPILLVLFGDAYADIPTREKRLSAYDPANLLLSYKEDYTPGHRLRPYRPKLGVTLVKEARVTTVNGKEIPLWLGDGFVRIPKRPVVSTSHVIAASAEQNVEVRFGGGPRPHYPYPRVPVPFHRVEVPKTTPPPVMVTLGQGRTPKPRAPFEATKHGHTDHFQKEEAITFSTKYDSQIARVVEDIAYAQIRCDYTINVIGKSMYGREDGIDGRQPEQIKLVLGHKARAGNQERSRTEGSEEHEIRLEFARDAAQVQEMPSTTLDATLRIVVEDRTLNGASQRVIVVKEGCTFNNVVLVSLE